MIKLFRVPALSRRRIWLAMAMALVADGLQLSLGPLGWVFVDQGVDVAAMVLISLAIGFHPLFLPTFLAEFIPVVDMLPTWTACVALVATRRWRETQVNSEPPPIPPRSDVIDV
jgi:polyferredoxin